ncbi:hypothetical protein EON64_18070, partial [archaeon]
MWCYEVITKSDIMTTIWDIVVHAWRRNGTVRVTAVRMLQPAQILVDASVDLRNGVVMHTNNVMTQIATGHALPEDINELPQCAEVVEQAVQELAVKIGERTGDDLLCGDARGVSAQDKQNLRTFLTRQVQEIRLASQTLAPEAADLDPLFPADTDISADFESLGGPNDDRLGNVGGFGVTYKRCYKPTRKVYALKEINVDYARSRGVNEDRLVVEAETLQQINDTNVVRCYHSFFSNDGIRFYLVMELVDGQTLDQI